MTACDGCSRGYNEEHKPECDYYGPGGMVDLYSGVEKTECPICEGSGTLWCENCGDPEHAGVCSTCDGTGMISKSVQRRLEFMKDTDDGD